MGVFSPMGVVKTFAERLRYARELRGMSQKQLADACGLSQSAISSYENDTRRSPQQLLKLATILGVDPYWLSRGTPPMHATSPSKLAMSEQWPFSSISPGQIWSLSEADRQAVENTLGALVDSLLLGQRK